MIDQVRDLLFVQLSTSRWTRWWPRRWRALFANLAAPVVARKIALLREGK